MSCICSLLPIIVYTDKAHDGSDHERRNWLTMSLHPYGIVNSFLLFKGTDQVAHRIYPQT